MFARRREFQPHGSILTLSRSLLSLGARNVVRCPEARKERRSAWSMNPAHLMSGYQVSSSVRRKCVVWLGKTARLELLALH